MDVDVKSLYGNSMSLVVLGSGSSGNMYILQNKHEALIIEAGVPFDNEARRALGWDTTKVVGVLVSHHHADHAGYARQMKDMGFKVYSLPEVLKHCKLSVPFAVPIEVGRWWWIGSYKVLPFPLVHYNTDGTRCPICGFLIEHEDCGRVCFFTDCADFSREVMTENGIEIKPYDFANINHWMIEANYDNYILYRSKLEPYLKDRIKMSHMSIQRAVKTAKRIDLRQAREIVLIHLSAGNGDERKFVREMRKATGKRVVAAHRGMVVDFSI